MPHALVYTFDLDFLRVAMRRDYYWKGLYLIVAFAVLYVAARLLPGAGSNLLAYAIGATLPLFLVALLWMLRMSAKRTYELWKLQAPDEKLELSFDDDGFDVRFQAGSTRYEWSGIRRLWRYHDVWLIEVVKNVSVFFPPEAATPETLDFVVARCEEAGVKT